MLSLTPSRNSGRVSFLHLSRLLPPTLFSLGLFSLPVKGRKAEESDGEILDGVVFVTLNCRLEYPILAWTRQAKVCKFLNQRCSVSSTSAPMAQRKSAKAFLISQASPDKAPGQKWQRKLSPFQSQPLPSSFPLPPGPEVRMLIWLPFSASPSFPLAPAQSFKPR